MGETENFNNWYTEYRKQYLDNQVKKCKTFATVSGTVAALSALVVAGNLVFGNGSEILQVGGSTFAMASYLAGYSKVGSLHKSELKELNENVTSLSYSRQRLETLKYELETNRAYLNMDYFVAGGFFASALGHVIELLSMQSVGSITSSVICSALAALTGTLYISLIKTYKKRIRGNQTEMAILEGDLQDVASEEPEIVIDAPGVLEVDAPLDDSSKKLVFEEKSTIKK